MSVYKPGKGRFWHFDFVIKGRRYYGSTGATTRARAEGVELAKRVLAAKGELDRPEVAIPTLDQAADAWWLTRQHLKTADALQLQAAQLVAAIGATRPVNSVTLNDVERAIQKRRAVLVKGKTVPTGATINRTVIAVLRPILKHARLALNDGSGPPVHFPEIPWGRVRQPERKPRPREFTAAEFDAVIGALPPHLHDFARFMARYGCRLGEMFFRPEEVDVEGMRVRLRDRKAGDDHVIPLLPEDAALLASLIGRARAAKLATVWFKEVRASRTSPTKLLPTKPEGARAALKKAMIRTGLRDAKGIKGAHDLRHHAGMQILRASGNLRAAQQLLGHASITSTLVYAHALEDDVRNALRLSSKHSAEPGSRKSDQSENTPRKSG